MLLNDDLAHQWATQREESGHGSHFSFRGTKLYSYNTQIAEIKNGCALFCWGNYSVTTATQKNKAIEATSHYKQMFVESFDIPRESNKNVLRYISEIEDKLRAIPRARNKDERGAEALELVNGVETYISVFGFDLKKLPKAEREKLAGWLADKDGIISPANLQAMKEAEQRRKEAEDKKNAKKIKQWQRGEISSVQSNEILLRKHANGEDIETSKGARVDLKAARVLFAMWSSGRDVVGQMLNHYQISAANQNRVVINCHVLNRKEILRFAQVEKWSL